MLGRVGKYNIRKLGSKYSENTEDGTPTVEPANKQKRKKILSISKENNKSVDSAVSKKAKTIGRDVEDDDSLNNKSRRIYTFESYTIIIKFTILGDADWSYGND